MSTSTWPKSERVALLWGDRWWIEGRSEPVLCGDFALAAESLLAAFGADRPARLRLVYQPDFLAAESIECPAGPRAVLQAALGSQFPALLSPDRAWGFEPIAGRERCATVLYHEGQPGLYPLAQALEEAGIEMVGAWPLAPLLNLVPEDWSETGALTVVAVAASRTLVFRHLPDGRREVLAASGDGAAPLALETVRATLARSDIALHVAVLDATGSDLLAQVPPLEVPRLRIAAWARLARAAETLSRRQPTQLLPLSALFAPARLMLAASVALFLTALGLGGDYAWREHRARDEAVARAQSAAQLREEIAQRRNAQAEWRRLTAVVEAGAPAAPLFAPWLRGLGRNMPPEAVLTTLHLDRMGFALTGGVTRPVADAAWRAWLQGLAPPESPWLLADASVPTADFRLTGRARP